MSNHHNDDLIQDALRQMKTKPIRPQNDQEIIVEQAKAITHEVLAIIRQVTASPGPHTQDAVRQLIWKLYIDKYRTWSKDELIFIVSLMHTEQLMQELG